jgi:hypothetical protein
LKAQSACGRILGPFKGVYPLCSSVFFLWERHLAAMIEAKSHSRNEQTLF